MRDGRGTLHRDDRVLSNSPSVTIRAFPALSIADARAHEGTDETIDFVVSLDRAALHPLTVDNATSDGSAKAEGRLKRLYLHTGIDKHQSPSSSYCTYRFPTYSPFSNSTSTAKFC